MRSRVGARSRVHVDKRVSVIRAAVPVFCCNGVGGQ